MAADTPAAGRRIPEGFLPAACFTLSKDPRKLLTAILPVKTPGSGRAAFLDLRKRAAMVRAGQTAGELQGLTDDAVSRKSPGSDLALARLTAQTWSGSTAISWTACKAR